MAFAPDRIRKFIFVGHEFDSSSGLLRLDYGFDDSHVFSEKILFPPPYERTVLGQPGALQHCFDLLHWLAGISYYKAAVPPQIEFRGALPAPATADFLRQVYTHGLAEFAFKNHLRLANHIHFESEIQPGPARVKLTSGSVLPLGGGKDSLVSWDLLHKQHVPFRTIAVGQAPLIRQVASLLPTRHLRIGRRLDPQLAQLNQAGAYNGHVPISAILAAVMMAGGLLYGYDTIIMSNERSASEDNVMLDDGVAVNHQWSKSLAFEDSMARLIENQILPGFRYFSLLRGWSEIRIARHFAGLKSFHPVFSSCNRNFTQNSKGRADRWCGNCPKCRFVAVALAPFMTPAQLTAIMGRNLLDDPKQVSGYQALAGVEGIKPFECVGEIAESRTLLKTLTELPHWTDMAVVRQLAGAVFDAAPLDSFLSLSDQHRVPREFLAACT